MPFRKKYQALANLSLGRVTTGKDGDKQADIVHKGETVELDEDVAQGFLTRHRVPVIRPVAEKSEPAPAIRARDLFGKQPGAAQFGARPDPAGASKIVVNEDVPEQGADPEHARNAPEASDPQPEVTDPDVAKDR